MDSHPGPAPAPEAPMTTRRMLRLWWAPGAFGLAMMVFLGVIALFAIGWRRTLTDWRGWGGVAAFVLGLCYFCALFALVAQLLSDRRQRRRDRAKTHRVAWTERERLWLSSASERDVRRLRRRILRSHVSRIVVTILLAPLAVLALFVAIAVAWKDLFELMPDSVKGVLLVVGVVAALGLGLFETISRVRGLGQEPVLYDVVVRELGGFEGEELSDVALSATGAAQATMTVRVHATYRATAHGLRRAEPGSTDLRMMARDHAVAGVVDVDERAVLVGTTDGRLVGRLATFLT